MKTENQDKILSSTVTPALSGYAVVSLVIGPPHELWFEPIIAWYIVVTEEYYSKNLCIDVVPITAEGVFDMEARPTIMHPNGYTTPHGGIYTLEQHEQLLNDLLKQEGSVKGPLLVGRKNS